MMTDCRCDGPGFCEHLDRKMPPGFWKRCHTEHAYCEMFQRQAAKQKSKGLGDTLARLTEPIRRRLGLQKCGGCQKRQAALNRWFPSKRP